ncbi:MAG: alpha,alpha-trehalase TreF [Microscillaceae bacterium]|jgi:alpha,alpha-trehalase|nr:alpha,alpha-trehalase TreF [Microscillaceae bacterium]
MKLYLLLFLWLVAAACQSNSSQNETQTVEKTNVLPKLVSPDRLYGDLFVQVQMQKIFPDGKTFVDCKPKIAPAEILKKYESEKRQAQFDLKKFVNTYFELPPDLSNAFRSDTSLTAEAHLNRLWDVLTRQPDPLNSGTLIPLPKPYIVPGGRFREVYYWDSYFTMLGLQVAGKAELIENILDNFAYLIDNQGFIPNGNRTYYLGRSQPPFFAMMVSVLGEMKGKQLIIKYLPQLEKEYKFWMNGQEKLSADALAHRRVVRMPDGEVLNRYWDDFATPRPESYREDVETAQKANQTPEITYRDLRAGAESGWDFSSRWFGNPQDLATIQTTQIAPVDLNCLLYNLENLLAQTYASQKNQSQATHYQQLAQNRKKAILKYFWHEKLLFFTDYHFIRRQKLEVLSLAGVYPLSFQIAEASQAQAVAQVLESKFLRAGGLVTTLTGNGQQWDAPNGWAPLQWMSIWGLRNYQQTKLAQAIKTRWTQLNIRVYKRTGKMLEKYNVENLDLIAGGGEYPLQDGFGWSNGVLLRLLSESE